MELSESKIRTRLNALVAEKLNSRKKELAEAVMGCNCVAATGTDCGCEETTKKEAFEEHEGRQVYVASESGAYDELHGKEGGPKSPDQYSKEMNLGKSDNVNDGYRAGSQKAFEELIKEASATKTDSHPFGVRIRNNKGTNVDTFHKSQQHREKFVSHWKKTFPNHDPSQVKHLDEDSCAGLGTTSLGGMDSTDGMLFARKTKDTPKKKVWGLKEKKIQKFLQKS